MTRPGKALLPVVLLCTLLVLPASASADTRRTAVITYYASDESGPEAGLEEKIAKTMFGAPSPPNVYTVQEYFLAQTFGKVNFSGSLSDVFGPYQVATPKANCPWPTWNNEAAQLAQGDGFSHSNYDVVVYIYENEPFVASECSASGTGGGSFAWIDSLSDYTIVHELGHLLGSPHAAAYRCWGADGVTPVTYSGNCREVFPPGNESSEYGDPFDPMGFGHVGSFPAEMTAWRKLNFGAIPPGDAPTITTDGTYTIAPLEQGSGVRLLRIPSGAGEYLDLDFRQPIGPFDQGYGSAAVNGVAIHVDTAGFDANRPSRLLDTTPETPTFDDAPLAVGRQFRDFDSPLTVETLTVGSSGATVKISGLPPRIEPIPEKRCKVPALKGKKKKAARKALRKRGCKPGKVKLRPSKKVPKGKVISQKPKAGRRIKEGARVTLIVSSGPPKR